MRTLRPYCIIAETPVFKNLPSGLVGAPAERIPTQVFLGGTLAGDFPERGILENEPKQIGGFFFQNNHSREVSGETHGGLEQGGTPS